MNRRQRKILEFLEKKEASEFITQEEIATNTGLTPRSVGSECYKLRESGYLESGDYKTGEEVKYRITALGQSQLDVEDDKRNNLNLMKKTTIATIILAIATVGLAIGTTMLALDSRNQTNMMQHDFDINNRPWIGGEEIEVFENKIVYHYKNYGKVPNFEGRILTLATSQMPTKDDILSERAQKDTLHVMMPSQKLESPMVSPELAQALADARAGERDLYIGVAFEYGYGNDKIGTFGFIGAFNPTTNDIDLLETWGS